MGTAMSHPRFSRRGREGIGSGPELGTTGAGRAHIRGLVRGPLGGGGGGFREIIFELIFTKPEVNLLILTSMPRK